MPAKAGIHGAAAPGPERWIPASAGMTVARRRERRNRRARGAAICVLALAPAVLATGEAAAQSAALKLDQVEGRTVTLTATVPTVCDVGAFSIQWGDGSSEAMFPPPLSKGIDCNAPGSFSQKHRHSYGGAGHYDVALGRGRPGVPLARLDVTVR